MPRPSRTPKQDATARAFTPPSSLDHEALVALAERRAARLQMLRETGTALSGVVDEAQIARELARQVERMIGCDGVAVVLCDGAAQRPTARREHGAETPVRAGGHCEPLVAEVLRTRAPVRVRKPGEGEPGARTGNALVGIPALAGGEVVAVVAAWSARPEVFGDEDLEAMLTVGTHAASAIGNARRFAESMRERRRGEVLADIARAVNASLRLDDVMHRILRHAIALLRAHGAGLALVRDAATMEIVAGVGAGEQLVGMSLPTEGTVAGRSLRNRVPAIINDPSREPEAYGPTREAGGIERILIVPLFASEGPIGVIAALNREAEFTEEDASVLQRLADHVAVAVVNARLFEERNALAERYRRVLETTSDAIVMVDRERRIAFTNPAADTLLGVAATPLGVPMSSFLPPELHDRVAGYDARALAGEPQRYEAGILTATGERRVVAVSTAPLRDGGKVTGIVASMRDVTDERRARDAVVRSEARYSRLVESASDAIFTVDEQGMLTSVNRSLERAVGRTRESLLGAPFVGVLDPRDQGAAAHVLAATMLGERKRAELRYPAASGELRSCSLLTTPIVEDGRVTGVLGIVRDVTDEKRLTEQLMQQEKLAAVGQLVSGVAHELNNPLAGVMAFSQLLLAAPEPEGAGEQRKAIEAIHQEAKRAAKIVSNLLTFARQHQPERQLTDLNRVVTDTFELRRYAMRVQQVEVDLQLDPLLPLTWADPFQLQQVVLNLLTNAEQALAEWPGERRIVVETARSGAMLGIRVHDSGPGIASEHLSRIFNPFFTTKGVGEGTGLGLSISDGIVREHGGRIRVESQPTGEEAAAEGSGTTFVIELPYTPPPEPERPAAAEPVPTAAGVRWYLVVDDEPAIRTAIATYLRSLGHQVHSAAGGREALDCTAANRYDGIVLDLRMPEVPGDEVYRELLVRAPDLARRVVFLTGDLQSESARRFLADSGRPVVTKPFLLDDLAAALLVERPA